jgi:isopenicillin N synthase-like dioxygenase
MTVTTSHASLPPFDDSLETAPLVSISLAKLEAGDAAQELAYFRACCELGFFYLDMLGSKLGEAIVNDSEKLNAVQTEFFNLPSEEKDAYGRDLVDPLYSYRYRELDTLDESGKPGRVESYNVNELMLPSYA